MITVLGATGHTGKVVADRLLDAGARVRVVGRSAERLQPFVARGADAAIGDVTSADDLTRAFTGADAAYLLVPPDYAEADYFGRYEKVGHAFVTALQASGVTHAVLVSSIGAELPSGTGPIVGLHRLEDTLRAVPGLNLLILRPGYFFDNHLATLDLIKHQGINGGALAPDEYFAQTATADIGAAAADALRARAFTGVTIRELSGPRDLSMAEVTRIIGVAIGKPDLQYVQFPPQDYVASLVQQVGFPQPVAELFLEMADGLSSGRIHRLTPQTPETTGPTTVETWVKTVFEPAYRA